MSRVEREVTDVSAEAPKRRPTPGASWGREGRPSRQRPSRGGPSNSVGPARMAFGGICGEGDGRPPRQANPRAGSATAGCRFCRPALPPLRPVPVSHDFAETPGNFTTPDHRSSHGSRPPPPTPLGRPPAGSPAPPARAGDGPVADDSQRKHERAGKPVHPSLAWTGTPATPSLAQRLTRGLGRVNRSWARPRRWRSRRVGHPVSTIPAPSPPMSTRSTAPPQTVEGGGAEAGPCASLPPTPRPALPRTVRTRPRAGLSAAPDSLGPDLPAHAARSTAPGSGRWRRHRPGQDAPTASATAKLQSARHPCGHHRSATNPPGLSPLARRLPSRASCGYWPDQTTHPRPGHALADPDGRYRRARRDPFGSPPALH